MKKFVWIVCLMTALPNLLLAQNVDDDMYYVPSKKKASKTTVTVYTTDEPATEVTVNTRSNSSTGVIVRDAEGNIRDIDEYNRRYTSRDNTFATEDNTLVVTEKPADERGEWVNGFTGSATDYEYAMRIIKFRSPRYGILVGSPLYWDIIYSVPSWEWNIYDDGLYAYVLPSSSNLLYWDWRFYSPFGWGWNGIYHAGYYGWGWHDWAWYGSWGPGWYGHHYAWHPGYGSWYGVHGRVHAPYIGRPHGSSALHPALHSGRYHNNYSRTLTSRTSSSKSRSVTSRSTGRNNRSAYTSDGRRNTNRNYSGKVVEGERNSRSSVRSSSRSSNTYSRPVEGKGSSYNRASSTRGRNSNSNATSTSTYRRSEGAAASRGAYRSSGSSSRSSGSSSSRSSYSSGSSSRSSGNSYSRSSSRRK